MELGVASVLSTGTHRCEYPPASVKFCLRSVRPDIVHSGSVDKDLHNRVNPITFAKDIHRQSSTELRPRIFSDLANRLETVRCVDVLTFRIWRDNAIPSEKLRLQSRVQEYWSRERRWAQLSYVEISRPPVSHLPPPLPIPVSHARSLPPPFSSSCLNESASELTLRNISNWNFQLPII